jgi:hypothetical protein
MRSAGMRGCQFDGMSGLSQTRFQALQIGALRFESDSLRAFGAVLLLFLCFYCRLFHQATLTIKYGG